MAVHDDRTRAPCGDLVEARLQARERDERGALDVRPLPLVLVAHVEQQELLARRAARLHRMRAHLRKIRCRFGRGGHPAEALVVDQLGDLGRGAAHGTVGVLLQAELVELHAQRVVLEQPSVERLAGAGHELHGLGRLDQRDQARQDAEHASLGARRHGARRRRLRKQAAVAGAVARIEDRRLSVEAEDGAMDVGLAEQHAGVVAEIAGGEVVGAVDDHVVLGEEAEGVLRGEAQRVTLDHDVRVHRGDALGRHLHLGAADIAGSEEHLAVQVGGVDDVEVDDPEPADTGRGEVLRGRTAQAARTDQQHPRRKQRLLTFESDFGKDQMAAIALVLLGL
jgi:hypothetical protein